MRMCNLAWLLLVLLCCCNKQDSNNGTGPSANFVYSVHYDSVYTSYAYNNVSVPFYVNVTSGDIFKNPVSVSVSGLPSGILISPPSFTVTGIMGGTFTLALGNVAPGNDTGNITFSTAAHGTETHKLIIKVLPPIDYAPKLAGTYTQSYDFCQPDSFFYYSAVVTKVIDTPYLIKISNVKNLGYLVRAWLSTVMGQNRVTIPVQSIGPYTIWGSGTFFHDVAPYDTLYQLSINDTLVHGVDTDYCTIHIQH